MKDWNFIRSKVEPEGCLSHSDSDVFLKVSHKEASPFGEEAKETSKIISGEEKEVREFFIETSLREMLFDDYVNGDAVPELQNKNCQDILDILLEGARNGEFENWHDGLKTLEEIDQWISADSSYDSLNEIAKKHSLNLSLEYFSSKYAFNHK